MTTDYTNVKLGDVTGWAPTPDTFEFNFNYCDGGKQFVPPANGTIKPSGGDGNVAAIRGLRDGDYDALYIYADQIYNFIKSGDPLYDDIANGFGTDFAYIHTGLDQWSINGTTLAISKRGSGLKQVLDPCIAAVQRPTPHASHPPRLTLTTYHAVPLISLTPRASSSWELSVCPSPPPPAPLAPAHTFAISLLSLSPRAHVNTRVAPPPLPPQLVKTQTYQDICTKHFPASSCINNPAAAAGPIFYDAKMNERTDAKTCADGYCTCSASSA